MNPIDRILSFFTPDVCVGCGAEGGVLCLECQDTISSLPSVCYACGIATRNFKPCVKCISKNKPGHVWISYEYGGMAKDLVKAYKFNGARRAAKIMAAKLAETLPYFTEEPLITFVPTSLAKTRERGFDHAKLLSGELAKQRGWHYSRLLVRQKQTRQLGASREQRKSQLKNSFRIVDLKLIKSRHILIVDDVLTTGATIETCAKVLKKAGVVQVDAVVFARTPNLVTNKQVSKFTSKKLK